ncbi:FAD-binding protein [Sphingobium sufflavum]|nr:FAD-binding protein [Sphingobium sufflavum]
MASGARRDYVERYKVADRSIDKAIPVGWVEGGYPHKADTIDGLARSIGVDPASLTATVARWNGFVAGDRDEDFHRGERAYDNCDFVSDPFSKASSLGAIAGVPIYAVPVVPGDVSTYGGVVTDEIARVIRADGGGIGRPVPRGARRFGDGQ